MADTRIRKGRDGWEAETDFVLNSDTPRGKQVLRIYTGKSDNGVLYTSANVHFEKDGCITFIVFGDFRQTIAQERVRCTDKNVGKQHADALLKFAELRDKANAFYAEKGGVGKV